MNKGKERLKQHLGEKVEIIYKEYGKVKIKEGILENVNDVGVKLKDHQDIIPFEGWGIGIERIVLKKRIVLKIYENPSLSLPFENLTKIF